MGEVTDMKLLDYMKAKGVDDIAMAGLVGDTSPRAVKKWKYGETTPPLTKLVRIQEVTGGAVKPTDFLPSADHHQRKAS